MFPMLFIQRMILEFLPLGVMLAFTRSISVQALSESRVALTQPWRAASNSAIWRRTVIKLQSGTFNSKEEENLNFSIPPGGLSDNDDALHPKLPPHTFAGMVERAMIERFWDFSKDGKDKETNRIDRILESWRLLDRDYVHKEHIGKLIGLSSSPVDDSKLYQLCHSYVPGLTIREFWDTSEFSWCAALQAKYRSIRDEFLAVTFDLERLTKEGNNIWASALSADVAQSYGEGWSTLVLMNRGIWDPINVQLFPVTARAIYDSQVPAVEVFFASMKPNTSIPPHSDFTNFVLTSHLAIDIPYSGQNKCRLSVGSTERQWINGEVSMFDTSIMHDAVNESDQMRYILMFRVWHPDLTGLERQALQFTYDALECPEIVTAGSQEERDRALRKMNEAKAFPALKKGTGLKGGGFGVKNGKTSRMPRRATSKK
jgi:Aspartyl/Asparaginyl beta-hydroxylase